MGWRPLLTGGLADSARAAAEEVCAALEAASPEEGGAATFSPVYGERALLFAYAAAALGEPRYGELSEGLLDRAVEVLEREPTPPWLHGGFAGLALAADEIERLAGRGGPADEAADDANSEIDEALLDALAAGWSGDYDLITGLSGLGTYLVSRLPRPAAERGLELVVACLAERSERTVSGTAWHTPPERLPAWQREIAPEGYYNLGAAHGVPAVVAVLARALEAGVAVAESRRLLGGAVDWLLAQRQPPEVGSHFPSWTFPGQGPVPSRLAWCYGDAGVAGCLLAAARRAGRADWETEAVALLLDCARRSASGAGVNDAGLCHGSAGLGHLFNRAWQATGREELATAARSWFAHALDTRLPGFGAGGFFAYEPYAIEGGERVVAQNPIRDDRSFLSGAAGIALALLAATTSQEPAWDRRLLLDLPPDDRNARSVRAA